MPTRYTNTAVIATLCEPLGKGYCVISSPVENVGSGHMKPPCMHNEHDQAPKLTARLLV